MPSGVVPMFWPTKADCGLAEGGNLHHFEVIGAARMYDWIVGRGAHVLADEPAVRVWPKAAIFTTSKS